ncbi:hypothetical protein WA026_004332 [Henosepilachna vigintioctopunctata]|uniref:very-long-chain enoyl-CoA reductase n=1 Tax=Henosepilachna vigintioctopunctata TaxID=420089 RepID=A0AAW1V9R4_9CUCU
MVNIEVLTTSNKSLGKIDISESSTVKDFKSKVANISKISVERQSLRQEARGKDINNDIKIDSLKLGSPAKIYVKDLGPQVGWSTVFLAEYAGPIAVYTLVGASNGILHSSLPPADPTLMSRLIYWAWILHYLKRILETIFVHRFSHGTMPIRNLFKNCSYYWGFAFYVAYHVNHPLWTEPPAVISYLGFAIWTVCELGNLSTHLLLRDLRPAGSTVRKIPYPNSNPLTGLFDLVSCPNYTYEVGSWLGYTLMSGCLPALIFTLAGFYQMSVWAMGKHRNYKKEFSDYPKQRKAIIPFVL